MVEEVKEINSNSKTKGLVYWTGLVPHGGIRNAIQNQQGRTTGPTRRSRKWTGEEDKILADAVKRYNSKNWKKIAECVPDRTDVQCLHRWQKVLDPKLVKGPWKKEEDDLIRELVEKHGNKKWSQVAKHLTGRIGKQCRERWHNHLNPDINRTPWTKEEEAVLIKAHGAYGNKWAEIAKLLHGRTENSIKNHWNCSVRKRIESYPARGLDFYSYKTKADGKKLEVGKQRNDRGVYLCSNVEPCSLDLVLGNVGRREGQLKASDNEICKEWNDSAKSTGRTIGTKATDTCVLSNQDCRESASSAYTSESTDHSSVNQPGKICDISFGSFMRSPYSQERTHETTNTINSLPSEALSPSLDLSLSTPFSAHGYDETMDEHEKNRGAGGPNTTDKLHRGLCYESLQPKDLNVFLETGSFPSSDCYIRTVGGPGSFSTPISRNRVSPNCSSPESRLRSKARSFKSTPSIIRKRSSITMRQAGSSDKDDNGRWSLGSCSSDKDDDDVDLLKKKQLFLSPPKSKKLETSEDMKSVEKRLEYAFNIEG